MFFQLLIFNWYPYEHSICIKSSVYIGGKYHIVTFKNSHKTWKGALIYLEYWLKYF